MDFEGGYTQEQILAQIQMEAQYNKTADPTSSSETKTAQKQDPNQLNSAALKNVKKKYMPYNIYLLPCSQCSDGLMALHLKECLKPNCKGVNDFQQKYDLDNKQWEACLAEINALTWWHGPDL